MNRPVHHLSLILCLAGGIVAQDDGKAVEGAGGLSNRGPQLRGTGNSNMTVRSSWDRASGIGYNDVWGWTAPDGREFAFVGETAGIWFVETTDPDNLVQVGWWSAPNSTWRDFTNLGHFVYSVSEHHRGIRVFDMSNPSSPQDLGIVGSSAISRTHNIRADPATQYLYLSGTNQGLAIFDATNPAQPQFVASWNQAYTHDCCVRRGRAYLSNGRGLVARIMDASNPANLVEIGQCPTPGGYDHNVWVSEDDQLLVVTDELAGVATPHMTVWDISNPVTPVKLGDYDGGPTVHNAYILGRTAFMSYYTAGIHVVDLGDPTNPTRIASYDTSTSTSTYGGAWGCYAFADSGIVYGSDRSNGLYVLQVDCGHINRYGAGTPGTGNRVPRARLDGSAAKVDSPNFRVEIEDVNPGAAGALFVGSGSGSTNFLGIEILVDLNQLIVVPFTADANGEATIQLPIRNAPALGNQRFYMQVITVDPQGPQGLAASRGMWFGICP